MIFFSENDCFPQPKFFSKKSRFFQNDNFYQQIAFVRYCPLSGHLFEYFMSEIRIRTKGYFYNQLIKYQVIYVLGRVEDIIRRYTHRSDTKKIATIRNNFLFYSHFKSTRPILKIFKSVRKITKICRDPNLIR